MKFWLMNPGFKKKNKAFGNIDFGVMSYGMMLIGVHRKIFYLMKLLVGSIGHVALALISIT